MAASLGSNTIRSQTQDEDMKRVRNPAADGHTLRSARFPLPSTWSADSSSTPSSAGEERTHTHTPIASAAPCLVGIHTHACTNIDACTTRAALSCSAPRKEPNPCARECAHSETQKGEGGREGWRKEGKKKEQISLHYCLSLQASASPNSANPVCCDNCHTRQAA